MSRYFVLTAGPTAHDAIDLVEARGHVVVSARLTRADSVPLYGICEVEAPEAESKTNADSIRIVERVAKESGVSMSEIMGSGRDRRSTGARARVALALRRRGLSFPEIGMVLRRHHTTCMYLVRRAESG